MNKHADPYRDTAPEPSTNIVSGGDIDEAQDNIRERIQPGDDEQEATVVHLDTRDEPAHFGFIRPPNSRDRSDNIYAPAHLVRGLQIGTRVHYRASEDKQGRMRVTSLRRREDG
jgi:hypothetical protein